MGVDERMRMKAASVGRPDYPYIIIRIQPASSSQITSVMVSDSPSQPVNRVLLINELIEQKTGLSNSFLVRGSKLDTNIVLYCAYRNIIQRPPGAGPCVTYT
jgi:hypothetical protein